MKIAFLLGSLNVNGGIGRVVSIVSNSLVNRNIEILLITMDEWEAETSLYKTDPSIEVIGLGQKLTMKKLMLSGGIKLLRQILIEHSVDCCVSCGALFFPIGLVASRQAHVKHICWEHSNANNKADHRFQIMCRRIGTTFSDATVVLTKQDYKLYQSKFHSKKLQQIYNPVDQNIIYHDLHDTDNKKILSVGRLTYQKNYPALIEVAKKVLAEKSEWEWHIYGEGDDRPEVEELIRSSGYSDRIILKGQVNDLYNRYAEYSFYVLTSRYEGLGMCLLEALSSGLPVLSFDVECGPREIIEDGINGYLIKAFDVDSMASHIIKLCSDKNEYNALLVHIKEKHLQFNLDSIAEKWINLFTEIVKEKK